MLDAYHVYDGRVMHFEWSYDGTRTRRHCNWWQGERRCQHAAALAVACGARSFTADGQGDRLVNCTRRLMHSASFTCWGHYSDAWVTPGKSKSDLAESRRYVLSTAVRSVTPKQDRGGQGGPRQRRCPVDWVGPVTQEANCMHDRRKELSPGFSCSEADRNNSSEVLRRQRSERSRRCRHLRCILRWLARLDAAATARGEATTDDYHTACSDQSTGWRPSWPALLETCAGWQRASQSEHRW
ncbi:hypothetical protein GQ600_19545 [Phytophthora cactorum]|nr:hypothetical protein GQ600_19545 [Phytophthora cactorum]